MCASGDSAVALEAFRTAFGRPPRSFRAGRFGIGENTVPILDSLGYAVESSVTPHVDWSDVSPGLSFVEQWHRYLLFDVTTSLGWDTGRAVTNVLAIVIAGPAALAAFIPSIMTSGVVAERAAKMPPL